MSESGTGSTTISYFAFTSDDPDAGFECRIQLPSDAGTWTEWRPCEEGGWGDGFYRWTDYSASGPARFSVRAVAGGETDSSPAERSFTIDVDPPETTITGGPPANELFAPAFAPPFTFVSSEPASKFECRVFFSDHPHDYLVESDCRSPLDAEIATFAHGRTGARFVVWAIDAVGNVDLTPASRPLLVDSVGPKMGFHSMPSGPISDDTPTFDWWTDDPQATVTCRIDSQPFEPCESPATFGPLPDGEHTFQMRAVDPLGNGVGTTELSVVLVDTRVDGPEVQLARESAGRPVVIGKVGAAERTSAKMRAVVKVGGERYRLRSRTADIPADERRRLAAVPHSGAKRKALEAALASADRASVRTVTRFEDPLGN
jgi:hypothetical protein